MDNPSSIFDFIDKEVEAESKQAEHYQVVAYQIMRLKKSTLGGYRRSVLDTVYVKNANQDQAKKIAISKATLLGKCCVIELAERIVKTIF